VLSARFHPPSRAQWACRPFRHSMAQLWNTRRLRRSDWLYLEVVGEFGVRSECDDRQQGGRHEGSVRKGDQEGLWRQRARGDERVRAPFVPLFCGVIETHLSALVEVQRIRNSDVKCLKTTMVKTARPLNMNQFKDFLNAQFYVGMLPVTGEFVPFWQLIEQAKVRRLAGGSAGGRPQQFRSTSWSGSSESSAKSTCPSRHGRTWSRSTARFRCARPACSPWPASSASTRSSTTTRPLPRRRPSGCVRPRGVGFGAVPTRSAGELCGGGRLARGRPAARPGEHGQAAGRGGVLRRQAAPRQPGPAQRRGQSVQSGLLWVAWRRARDLRHPATLQRSRARSPPPSWRASSSWRSGRQTRSACCATCAPCGTAPSPSPRRRRWPCRARSPCSRPTCWVSACVRCGPPAGARRRCISGMKRGKRATPRPDTESLYSQKVGGAASASAGAKTASTSKSSKAKSAPASTSKKTWLNIVSCFHSTDVRMSWSCAILTLQINKMLLLNIDQMKKKLRVQCIVNLQHKFLTKARSSTGYFVKPPPRIAKFCTWLFLRQ